MFPKNEWSVSSICADISVSRYLKYLYDFKLLALAVSAILYIIAEDVAPLKDCIFIVWIKFNLILHNSCKSIKCLIRFFIKSGVAVLVVSNITPFFYYNSYRITFKRTIIIFIVTYSMCNS